MSSKPLKLNVLALTILCTITIGIVVIWIAMLSVIPVDKLEDVLLSMGIDANVQRGLRVHFDDNFYSFVGRVKTIDSTPIDNVATLSEKIYLLRDKVNLTSVVGKVWIHFRKGGDIVCVGKSSTASQWQHVSLTFENECARSRDIIDGRR